MYPKIFDKTETEFSNNGLGFLPDVKKILVTEERNGGFYVEMEYPLNGVNAEYLKYDYIILVKPNPIDRPQPFRIYDTKKSKNNHSIAVKANHITFDDSQNFLVDFSRNKTTASTVLTQMRENRTNKNKITYSTDITTPITVDWSKRSPVNALAGEQGSFIQTLNSEIKRDMWSVTVNASRGRQSSFVARDEKGLTDFDLEEDVSSVVTKVYPFKTYKPEGSDEDKTITLKEKFIISENAGKYPFEKIAYLDLSQDETVTDEDSLRKVAQKQFTQEHIDLPKISGTLKIINLSKNPEYDFIGELSSVLLCDYIWCVSKTIKEKVQVQVNKVVYNPIIEDYDSLDVGIKKQSLGQSITNSINKVQNEVNKVQNQVNNIVVSADGTKSFYSDSAPTEPEYDLNDGDIWFQPLADGSINSWAWNDTQKIWQPIFNKEDFDSAFNDVNSGVEAAKKQAQEASNKADAIENMFENDLNNVRVDIDGVKHGTVNALQKAEDAVLNANAAQQGVSTLKDRVDIYSTNVGNLFPNGNFSDVSMKEFNLIGGRYTTQGVTNSPQGSFSQLGVAYPTKNANRNACTINNGKDVLEVKPEYSFNVNSGEEFYIQYDFYNDTPMLVEVGIIFNGGQKVAVRQNTAGLRSWHRIKGKVKAPDGATSGRGYISMSDNVSAYCFISNVSISRVDASTALIEIQDGKITEAVKQGETLNQRVQTAESTIESIENMEGNNTLVNTVKGQQQSIKDAQGNALEALETAKGTQTTIYNGGNLWMMPSFESGDLSKYYDLTDPSNVKIITNGATNTPTEGAKFNTPFKKQNPSPKALRIDGDNVCRQKEIFNQIAHAGETFNVSFDFYKHGDGEGYIMLNGESINFGSGLGGGWYHLDTTITLPSSANVNSVTPAVGSNGSPYIYFDNIIIQRADAGTEAQFSKLTQTADLIKGEVSSLDEKTKASLALLQDNINLKVDKDGLISQINLDGGNVLIDGKKIHLTGDTTIDNAIIPSAAIKDLSADKVKTGTLDASLVNVVHLDVNTLDGDYSQFLKTAWKDNNSYSEITPDGLKFYKEKNNIFSKDTYLSIYSNQLTWRTSNKAWHYINQSDNIIRNNLTIGAVTNNAEVPASINIRSSGYDTMTSVSQNGMYSGKYTFVGADYGMTISEGMKTAQSDLRAAEQPEDLGPGLVLDRHTYVTRVAAENNILMNVINEQVGQGFRFDTTSFDDETSVNHNFNIIYQDDNWSGLFIKSIPTYKRTYSYSSNMFVTSNGYIGRATSAKKYKQDIEYIDNIEEAKRTLDIQPAEWADKKVMEHRAKVRSTKNDTKLSESLRRRYIGFIADDFADAGFEKLVLRDDKGEVEEFQYDRLSVYHHQMIKDLYSQIDELKAEIEELKRGSEK